MTEAWSDRRFRALVGILLCLLGYLAVLLVDYHLMECRAISVRGAITFMMIFTCLTMVGALVAAFRPWRK